VFGIEHDAARVSAVDGPGRIAGIINVDDIGRIAVECALDLRYRREWVNRRGRRLARSVR
jgi:CBS domain-containing protein